MALAFQRLTVPGRRTAPVARKPRRSADGTEVAGILDAGEDDKQRRRSGEEAGPLPRARVNQGSNGLRSFRGSGGVEQFAGNDEDFDGIGQGKFGHGRLGKHVFVPLGDKNGDYFDTARRASSRR